MANRTGTYFGFDGLGESNPSKSDFKYYAIVQSWDAAKHIDFKFVDSHDKASAVRDSSKLETLKASIRQRLAASKNVVVILSDKTRKSGSVLSYEIEKAIDTYKLPLIVVYPDCSSILKPSSQSGKWPDELAARLNNGTAKGIHIPFKKEAILSAIEQFSVSGTQPNGALVFYDRETQKKWGYLDK